MEWDNYIKAYQNFCSDSPEKFTKATLFENDAILVGLNCFGVGQEMYKHPHREQNRSYIVLEGSGYLMVDEKEHPIAAGQVLMVPHGHAHRIRQTGKERLVVLVNIVPAHAD